MKIVVIGGVAGGATAIARLRRLNEDAEIILLERGDYVSFANCGLPYYVGGTISQRDALFVTTDEDIRKKYKIDVRVKNEVKKINKNEKKLLITDYKKGEDYELSYDKLLISTGSHPFVPASPGIDSKNVFTLWNIPDVDAITSYVKDKKPKKATVIGAGFIGLEMAENLVDLGIETTVIEMADQVMPPLDKDMAKLAENHMISKGVNLLLNEGFESIKNDGKTVHLMSGKDIDTDLIILSIGVRPNSELAKDAGLELTERGHIKVDDYMQTSDPNIYAIGDVIGVKDYITGNPTAVPLAGPANKQGREVASNILGLSKSSYKGTMGTSVAKIFDLTVASTGLNEKTLQRNGKVYKKDYFVSIIHPMSHAGYYPGAMPMTLKLIYGKDRKVLGGQIVGYDGVDKRIDTIATSIHFRGSVDDLSDLELAYAPPYSSAKDPVNFLGYTARNVLDGLSDPVLYREYLENQDRYTLLDVRENPEVVSGKLEGAVHIPLTELRDRLNELDKNNQYLAYCAVGLRGYIAERILKENGFNASNLLGGYHTVMDLTTSPKKGHTNNIVDTDQDKFASGENLEDTQKMELLNVCGMSCPGPIVQVSKAMEELNPGQKIKVTATDPGFVRDISSWADNTGNKLLGQDQSKGQFTAILQKNGKDGSNQVITTSQSVDTKKEKTMIIFDGDLDRAIASFIIATGAAAMGNKVHMFFTFWGLSILRKEQAPPVKKDFTSKMFSSMLPKGSKKLGLSRMNFMGAGSKMIRSVMKKKNITSLEDLIQEALDAGVELTACQMTMDIMGLTKEELIDGVEIGGVASMLSDNDKSNMNLFI